MGICCLNVSNSQANIIVENKVKDVLLFPQFNRISSSSIMTSNTQNNLSKVTTLKQGPIISKLKNMQRVRPFIIRQSISFS